MHLSKMPLRISRYLFHRTSEYRFQYFPTRRQFQCLEKPNLVRSDIVSFVECISQRCLYAYRGIYSTEHQSIDSNTFQPDANFSVLKSRISSLDDNVIHWRRLDFIDNICIPCAYYADWLFTYPLLP